MEMRQATANKLEARETVGLIGSDKVEGTAVYRSDGDRVGTIDRVMIDKNSGNVAYAVMSFGGFLGIGEKMVKVPLSHVHFMAEKAMMEGDKAALSAMPRYSYFGGGG